ncbi:MAG: hypothetical protein CMI27_03575 [Opitutae bacterium]|nr:hypothetical protein [Opitutae bacterium]
MKKRHTEEQIIRAMKKNIVKLVNIEEAGDINYIKKAKTKAFANLMLNDGAGTPAKQGNPLRTSDGIPFLETALNAIQDDYGSVEKYLKTEIGLSSLDNA